MSTEKKNERPRITDPMEEEQQQGVTVKLGQLHYEALVRWSKERFGLANCAGFMRLMIHERWQQEQKEKNAAAGNGAAA
jgi:hypothetical protein